MKKLLQAILMLWFASSIVAQGQPASDWLKNLSTLRVYEWKDLDIQQKLPGSEIVSMDGISALKIEITNAAPLEISLLKITNSSFIKKIILASCDMKYENAFFGGMQPPDRLVLFCRIPPPALGGDEKTNATSYRIEGTLNWKPYHFAIDRSGSENLPTELELKLYLAGSGTVYLRPIQLFGVASSGWWSAKQGAIVGGAVGIFGGIIGCFGGVLGCLAGFGKARKFVLTTTKIFIVLGMLLTITGIFAIICKQSFFVWYIFLLPGVMLTLIFSLNFPLIQRRYDDLEIRRMASIDTMGS